jgi:hypothetical protein
LPPAIFPTSSGVKPPRSIAATRWRQRRYVILRFADFLGPPDDPWADLWFDDDGRPDSTQHCAGALILHEKLGRPNWRIPFAGALGLCYARRLKLDAPVRVAHTFKHIVSSHVYSPH